MSIRHIQAAIDAATRSPAHKLILVIIANHANDSGTAWPSHSKIAARAGLQRRHAINIINDLEADGLLTVIRSRGRSNKYIVNPEPVHPSAHVHHSAPVHHSAQGGVHPSAQEVCTPVHIEPSMNRQVEPSITDSAPDTPDTDFETWWRTYPRKTGKRKAHTAYRQALTRCAGPWVLHQGLTAALPDLTTREPRYIPNPATWLNEDRWLDQPPPARPGNITRQHHNVMRLLGQATP